MDKFPSESFENLVNESIAKNLESVGFAVIDNIFGSEWCRKLREEIGRLHQQNLLYLNRTYYEGRKEDGKFKFSYSVSKPNVYELDLLQPETRKNVPYLQKLYDDRSMIEHLNSLLPNLYLNHLDIKVQFNAGSNSNSFKLSSGSGACFPMHFDTTQTVSNRQITGTLYLNPQWKFSDGGQLRMDIEPLNDRLVLFSSHQTLHRVLPSMSDSRYCITLWFSGSLEGPQFPSFPWLRELEGIGFILNPANRKSLAKVIYDDAWIESIRQSFGDKEDIQKILESHSKDIEAIRSKLGEKLLSFVQDSLPLSHSKEFLECTHKSGEVNQGA